MQWQGDCHELMEAVYEELRAVAELYFRRQPPGFTLSPTEILHEACLHLMRRGQLNATDTDHFRAIAVHKMWQVIVDHIKQRQAQKRGGPRPRRMGPQAEADTPGSAFATRAWKRIPLEQVMVKWRDRDVDLLDLADALVELGRENRRLRCVVILHWFGGMTHAEVARLVGISPSTAEKDFRYALAWLNRRLQRTATRGD